jgi:DNA polymerase (family 10)
MTKEQIGAILEDIGKLLEVRGDNPFKIRAYTNAARTLETHAGDLPTEVEELEAIPGIGKAIAEKIVELQSTGKLRFFEELKEEFPPDLLELFELQGLGGKRIKALYAELGIHSISKLERACRDGSLAALAGFGAKSAENILAAIEQRRKSAGQFLLWDAAELAQVLLDHLLALPAAGLVEVAGSYRRRKPVVRDLDFIVSTRKPQEVIEAFLGHPALDRVLAKGETKASAISHSGIQCDLRAVSSAEYPFALNYFTGSKEHNIRMRSLANNRGWTLNEYRLARLSESDAEPPPPISVEADLYRALDLDLIPPELREDLGEFDAAAAHSLPKLLEWSNLRGAFHNHTTESDGRSTLEEMAAAAQALGLEYLGIADHSRSSVQANGLDETRLRQQITQIRELEAELGGELRLLAGTECDIRKDGSLDFPDDLLAELDYVVISIHSAFSMGETAMTDRVIKAMHNPFAHILAHPTGRLLLGREAYAINIPAVLEAAAATGTAIELNANPRRLDLDWRWWPAAKKLGVRCTVNADAHSADGLRHLFLGVDIARKGWLTRTDVLNTLPVAEALSALHAKAG